MIVSVVLLVTTVVFNQLHVVCPQFIYLLLLFQGYRKSSIKPPQEGGAYLFQTHLTGGLIEMGGLFERGGGLI